MSNVNVICSAIESTRQSVTPVSGLFLSEQNIQLLQRAIKESVKQQTGYKIDSQSRDDLIVIMRAVYFNNYVDPYTEQACAAVKKLNEKVISKCTSQIADGILSYINYTRDASELAVPLNNSTYESIKGEFPLFQGNNI
jgi:hypothetical protein